MFNLFYTIKIVLCIYLSTIFLQAQNCSAEVRIFCDSNFVAVINDTFQVTSENNINLEKGTYFIKIKNRTKLWHQLELLDTITILECDKKYEFNYSQIMLAIQTEPSNAEVFNSNRFAGYTPLLLNRKIENLEIKKAGYKSIFLNNDELANKKIFDLEKIESSNSESFIETNLFKILIGSIVLLGTTSAYFKMEADENYEKYQLTGIEKFLNQTRTNDLIAGISFGLMQINFGFLIYNFLIK